MVCRGCGTAFEGHFCPKCGMKEGGKLFERLRPYIYSDSENIVSVLGNSVADSFVATGELSNGFAILTDKRVYFKGDCLVGQGKKYYWQTEEKSVNILDVTGTGFVHIRATWAAVLCVLSFLISIFAFCSAMTGNTTDPSIYVAFGFLVLGLIFYVVYKAKTYTIFVISYAGGGIGFNLLWIDEAESYGFQRQLNLMKDKVRADEKGPSVTVKGDLSVAKEIKEYKDLLDAGLITQEEFEQKRKQLLGL